MAKNLFSVPIFFIVFRETLEAAIIVSVLLGLVEQIVHGDGFISPSVPRTIAAESKDGSDNGSDPEDDRIQRRLLIRKLRIQVIVSAPPVQIIFILGLDICRVRFGSSYCLGYWCRVCGFFEIELKGYADSDFQIHRSMVH